MVGWKFWQALSLTLMIVLLAGCGFKGPLELPDEEQKRERVE